MRHLTFTFCSLLFVLISGCASAQKTDTEIDQKLDAKSGKQIVLVKMVNDSRCPEGVQCIWAGEVTIDVAAYEDKKLVEQVQFTINQSTTEDVKIWFTKHLPARKDTIKEISVLPHSKNGVQRKPAEYKIKLIY